MYIKILKDTETPTHSLAKGMIVDIQSAQAAILITSKMAKVPTAKELKALEDGN